MSLSLMNKTDENHSYLHDQNYLDLVAYYIDHPIALYTGAGVSHSDDSCYGVGLWDDFVRSILLSDKSISREIIDGFDKCRSKWRDKPWEMAEYVATTIGQDTFKQNVTMLVQAEQNFTDRDKLLSGDFLSNAKTLNATVAFCGELAGGKMAKDRKGLWSAIYQRSINPRVHAVVTSNYDYFLEAASSTMFRKPILKPVAARGSSVGSLREIPVFHIHGYVPFPYEFSSRQGIKHIPFVDLVITTSNYERAWKTDDVYNFTMGPQIHILRHYTVLFIGFSFRDMWVNDLLMKLNVERRQGSEQLYHYAILRKDEVDAKGSDYFVNTLGVKPIAIHDFAEIKHLLSDLYQQALIHDHPGSTKIELPLYEGKTHNEQDKPVVLARDEYFEELYKCRLSMVRKNKSYVYAG